ncbi:MAG: ABC transporter transmembrane domain-containing protein, partial [Pirellulaceae bacterium]
MNNDETHESRHESRITILSHLLEDAGPRSSRATIRRVLVELSGTETAQGCEEELELLKAAAEQLGVLTRVAWLTRDEVAVLLDQRMTLAAVGRDSIQPGVVLYGVQGGRFSARVGEVHQWLTGEELWNLLQGACAEERLPWLVREPYMMVGPVSVAAPGAVSADGGHDHHAAGHSHLHPLTRLATFLRPEARDVCIVAVFSVAVGVLSLATPLAVEALVNTVSFGRLLQPLFVLCLLLLAFLGFAAALRTLQAYVAELIQRRLFVRIVGDLAYRLPRVERSAFDDIHAPELLNRFFDVMTVQKSAALLVLDGMTIVLQVLIGMTVLAFYHPALLGFDVLLLVGTLFAVLVLGRGAVRTAIEESKSKYAVAAWLEELAQFSNTFKGAGGTRHAFETADALAANYVSARRAHFRVLMRQIVFALGMQAVCGSVLLALGGWLVIRAQITLGQLVAAELIVAVIVGSIAKFGKHMESFYDLLAAVDKIGHLLDLPIERQAGDAAPRGTEGTAVELRDVAYAFDAPVFKNLSLSVVSG